MQLFNEAELSRGKPKGLALAEILGALLSANGTAGQSPAAAALRAALRHGATLALAVQCAICLATLAALPAGDHGLKHDAPHNTRQESEDNSFAPALERKTSPVSGAREERAPRTRGSQRTSRKDRRRRYVSESDDDDDGGEASA